MLNCLACVVYGIWFIRVYILLYVLKYIYFRDIFVDCFYLISVWVVWLLYYHMEVVELNGINLLRIKLFIILGLQVLLFLGSTNFTCCVYLTRLDIELVFLFYTIESHASLVWDMIVNDY